MVIEKILSPQFLVDNIDLIALLLAGSLLVIFSDFVTKKIVFGISNSLKSTTHERIKAYGKRKNSKRIEKQGSKYIPEFIATAIFLLYIFFAAKVLAEYIFTPIFFRLKHIILLIAIGLFLLISWTINTKAIRRRLMRF